MSQAQTSKKQISYVAEVTYGTTPGTPAMQLIDDVSFDMQETANRISDPSRNAYRQTTFSRKGNIATEGSFGMTLCPDNADAFLEAVCMGPAWATNVLKLGTVANATLRSFSFEEGFTDIAKYRVFTGVVLNKMKLKVGIDGLVEITFDAMGKATSAFSGTTLDASPTAVAAKDKFFHDAGTFNEGGSSVGFLSTIEFELDNQVKANYALGSTAVRSMTYGDAKITGKVTGLFEDETLYNKYINNTDSSISFTLTSGAETLTFLLPKVKYTNGRIVSESGAGVRVEMDFEAVVDTSTELTSLKITRV